MTTKPFPLSHFIAPGTIVFYSERMEDELREVYYRILPAGPTLYLNNVRVARLGIVQGEDAYNPRYERYSVTNPVASEADSRTPVRPLTDKADEGSMFGYRLFARM